MIIRRLASVTVVAALTPGSSLLARGRRGSPIEPLPEVAASLAFIPSEVAERMLAPANVTSNDVVYDLGCGDGRIAILAAKKYGAGAVGIDTDWCGKTSADVRPVRP